MGLNQGTRDGLGGDRLLESGVGAFAISPFVLGSLTTSDNIIAGGSLMVTNAATIGGQGVITNVGSPYNTGLVVPITARAIISGGMFVGMSGGLAYPAAASSKQPLGVAAATAQSGATVNVIMYGIVPVIAEGTIAVNAPCMMGAGTALNTVLAADASSGTRAFSTLDAGVSGATVFIRL